jgi:cold shock protein
VTTRGTVRVWHDAEGWGVVDSAETPGGCWVHYSHLLVTGCRALQVGQEVEFEHEAPGQDGYAYRAVAVRALRAAPVQPEVGPPGAAYTSTLTLTFDDDDERR